LSIPAVGEAQNLHRKD